MANFDRGVCAPIHGLWLNTPDFLAVNSVYIEYSNPICAKTSKKSYMKSNNNNSDNGNTCK